MGIINNSKVMFIIYAADQEKSKLFYKAVLDIQPTLDVPGMTEFDLTNHASLGIMPGDGIVKILNNQIANPNSIKEVPRCELYLFVADPDACYTRALAAGGKGISPGEKRNWGDYVAYCSDFDGNIIAFAAR